MFALSAFLILADSSASTIEWVLIATATLVVALILVDRIAWRLPPFRWVVRRPDLRGTWAGTLASDYADGIRRDVFLIVHQTLSTLKLRLQTEESQSVSTMAHLFADPDEPVSLCYLYRSEPRLEHQRQSRTHWGAVRLTLLGPNGRTLTGDYWTDRKTAGGLDLRWISRIEATGWHHAIELAEADGGRRPEVSVQSRPVPRTAVPHERVPPGLADVLAEVAHDPEVARTLALRAKFPKEYLPDFKTSIGFWTAVVQQAASGRIEVRSLIEEASKQFPYNVALQSLAAGPEKHRT